MNGIYLIFFELENTKFSGVEKKVLDQLEVFKDNLGCEILTVKQREGILGKLLLRIPFGFPYGKWFFNKKFLDCSYIYVRKLNVNSSFIKSLKYIKKINPDVKIVMEIPTYPYDRELSYNFKNFPISIQELYYRKKLRQFVDRIVTYSDDDSIFGIKTIRMINGINYKNIKFSTAKTSSDVINLIAVASFAEWHGYDRLIRGIGEYYKNGGVRQLKLHLVGDGHVIDLYKRIVKSYNIKENVIFHGVCLNEDLDKIYEIADIGVEVLGMHRRGNHVSSSLKSREYLAKGLPFISSSEIDIIPNNWEYVLKVPRDESLIDIQSIINFYEEIYSKETSVSNINLEIRNFGEKNSDISTTLLPVIKYLKSF